MTSDQYDIIRHRLRLMAAMSRETGDLGEFLNAISVRELVSHRVPLLKLAVAAQQFRVAALAVRKTFEVTRP